MWKGTVCCRTGAHGKLRGESRLVGTRRLSAPTERSPGFQRHEGGCGHDAFRRRFAGGSGRRDGQQRHTRRKPAQLSAQPRPAGNSAQDDRFFKLSHDPKSPGFPDPAPATSQSFFSSFPGPPLAVFRTPLRWPPPSDFSALWEVSEPSRRVETPPARRRSWAVP